MEILLLVVAMIVVGVIMSFIAGFIWKERNPDEVRRDYIASIITAVVVGFMSWFIIPMLGFSDTLKYISAATEPAGSALIVLWIIRKAKK